MPMEQKKVDAVIRHHTYLDRFGGGLANRVLSLFDNEELLILVMSKRKFKKKIEKLLELDKKKANELIHSELRQVAKFELEFTKRLSKDFKDLGYTKKEIDEIIEIALGKPLIITNNTSQDLYDSAFRRKEEIAITLNQMGELGIKSAATINAEMIAMFSQFANSMEVANRTFTASVANEMREKAYADSRVVEWVVMSAVLDGRTTPYCMNIDGDKFPNGEGPRPPFHPRCRTIGIPIIEDTTDEEIEELLSFRPQIKPGEEYKKGDSESLRAHKAQVEKDKTKVLPAGKERKSGSNYANFLATQRNTKVGKQFIEDRLGIKKGRRFIKLIGQGVSPDKALTEILYETKAKDLDIKGLKKRVNK